MQQKQCARVMFYVQYINTLMFVLIKNQSLMCLQDLTLSYLLYWKLKDFSLLQMIHLSLELQLLSLLWNQSLKQCHKHSNSKPQNQTPGRLNLLQPKMSFQWLPLSQLKSPLSGKPQNQILRLLGLTMSLQWLFLNQLKSRLIL